MTSLEPLDRALIETACGRCGEAYLVEVRHRYQLCLCVDCAHLQQLEDDLADLYAEPWETTLRREAPWGSEI